MRGTLEQFQTSNIVLLDGEVAYIADKGKLKIGNNNTPFNDLPYIADSGFKGTIDSIDQLPTSGNNDGDQYFLLTSGQLYIYINNQWLTISASTNIDNNTIKKNESEQIYVDSLNVNKLTQTEGDTLILYCGEGA